MSSALVEVLGRHDETVPPPLPPVTLIPRQAPLVFSGRDRDFRALVTRGALLELVTAGFYRFWLATAIRRMLWSDTSLEGEEFSYHGTGKELFLGFLLAIAILAPLYFGYFLLGIEAERLKAFASVPFFLVLLAFQQFAIYRSRRYRLHRTTWRGLRFGMTGSGWAYAGRAMLWGGLAVATLGLSLPWSKAALERYKMRHTFFGDLHGRFEGRGVTFFKRACALWLVSLLFIVANVALFVDQIGFGSSGTKPVHPLSGPLFALTLIGVPFVWSAYRAIEWKWWVAGLRLGEVYATMQLKKRTFFRIYWTLLGVGWLTMLVGVSIGGALAWACGFGPAFGNFEPTVSLILGGGLIYLGTLLAIGVATRIYMIQRVWKAICGATIIHNTHLADDIVARPGTASALGEGFADSLDVLNF